MVEPLLLAFLANLLHSKMPKVVRLKSDSVPSPHFIFSLEQDQLAFALLAWEYETSIYIEKVDTAIRCPGLAQGLVRQWISEQTKKVHLFARSQDQYLFHRSVELEHKAKRSGSSLVKWWMHTVLPVSENRHVLVPGEPRQKYASLEWNWGLDAPLNATASKVIPLFDDDVKTKAIKTMLSNEATVEELIQVLPVMSECSGEVCGLISFTPQGQDSMAPEIIVEHEALLGFIASWMNHEFHNLEKVKESTQALKALVIKLLNKPWDEIALDYQVVPVESRPIEARVHSLSASMIKKKDTPNVLSASMIKKKEPQLIQGLVKRKVEETNDIQNLVKKR